MAATLRLWSIDLAPFAYDEVDVLSRARTVLGGALTATGPMTSWGVPDPPLSVYLMLPPSLLPRPGLAAAVWAAVLNVAAVVLTYAVARRFFGPWVALTAALLYAVNPWAVYFSRRTWAELQPLLTVLALWAALEVVTRRRAVWAVAFFLMLALQVQTRLLAFVYAPAALLTVAIFPRRWGVRWPLAGIALGVLVSVPYALYVVTHWPELAARLSEGNRGVDLTSSNSAPTLLLWTAAGYGLLPATSKVAPWLDRLGQVGWATLGIVLALIVGGLGLIAWQAVRRQALWESSLILGFWLVLPFAALLAQSSSVYLHYMVAVFPVVFLVMALPLGVLLSSRRRPLPILGVAILVAVASVQLATTGILYRVLGAYDVASFEATPVELRQAAGGLGREAADQLGTGERYGVEVPIAFWLAVAERARLEAARAELDEIWIVAGATDPLTAERPAVLDYVLRPALRPHFVDTLTLVLPAGRQALFLEAPDVDPAENLERFGDRIGGVPIPSTGRTGRDDARFTLVPARSADNYAGLAGTRNSIGMTGGVQLLAFRVPKTVRENEDLLVVTYWRLRAESPQTLPVVTPRLVDQSGRLLAEADPLATQPPPSPPGERVMVVRQSIPLRGRLAGEHILEAAVTTADGTPLRRADGRGDAALLGPIRVTAR